MPNITLPKCGATTGGTVSVYLFYVYYEQKRRRTQPCLSLTLTLKGFVFMPLTRTESSDCLYNDLIAANTADLSCHTPAVLPTDCVLEHGHMLFQGLQNIYTPLWHIPTISQKFVEGQRSGPWWICQDEICIAHLTILRHFFSRHFA